MCSYFRRFMVLSFVVLLVFPVHAKKQNPYKLMKKGDMAWEKGELNRAMRFYGRAARYFSDPELKRKALYYQGLGFYQRGHWSAALDAFEKALSIFGVGFSQDLHFYSGLSNYALRNLPKAISHFNHAMKDNTSAIVTEKAKLMLGRAKAQRIKEWNVFTSIGYLHNSNVALQTLEGFKHDTTLEERSAEGFNGTLVPKYDHLVFDRSRFTVSDRMFVNHWVGNNVEGYNVYLNKLHLDFETPTSWCNSEIHFGFPVDINLIYSGVRATSRNEPSKRKEAFNTVENSYLFSPSMKLLYHQNLDAELKVTLGLFDYKESGNERDGQHAALGVWEGFRFWGTDWRAGYEFVDVNAKGRAFERQDNKFNITVNFPFYFKTHVDLEGAWARVKYPDSKNNREEHPSTYSATLVKVFNNLLGISTNTTYTKTTAKPSTTSYERFTMGVNLFYNF